MKVSSLKIVESPIADQAQLSKFGNKIWDKIPNIPALSQLIESEHTSHNQRYGKSSQTSKSSHTVCQKRQSERKPKMVKIEETSNSAKSCRSENKEPIKVKFAVCKTNGYKLLSVSEYQQHKTQPFISRTKEQAIYEFHLQRTLARMKNQEKEDASC